MMSSRWIYLRHTDRGGRAHVRAHLVWAADRFIASQQEAAQAVNADAAKSPDKAKREASPASVEQITEETYLKEKSK